MGALYKEKNDIVEPFACAAVYCTGVARACISNGEIHLIWFIEQPGMAGVERVVNLRTIMPVDALAAARGMVDEALVRDRRRLDG